jgi:hypothetical protein
VEKRGTSDVDVRAGRGSPFCFERATIAEMVDDEEVGREENPFFDHFLDCSWSEAVS